MESLLTYIANAIDISQTKTPFPDKLIKSLNNENGSLSVVVLSWTLLLSGIEEVSLTIQLQ